MSSSTPPKAPPKSLGAAAGLILHPQWAVLSFRKGVTEVSDGMGGPGEGVISVAQLSAGEVNSVLGSDRPLSSCVTWVRALNLLELQFPYL